LTEFVYDVRPNLLRMDIFVLASVDCEGSSSALKEAMAIGLPTITTTIGGSAEIIENGENGILISPGSVEELSLALEKCIQNQDYCRLLGESARKHIFEHFSISNSADTFFDVYKRLAGIKT
jgi:L-malate glycosyltransferase